MYIQYALVYRIGNSVLLIVTYIHRRVRDNMDDKHVQTMVKQVDALSFAMGVFFILLLEYIVLAKPEYLATFTYCVMPTLYVYRYAKFKYF